MLSSEFNQEMGALIRSLEGQVRSHPDLASQPDRQPTWIAASAIDAIDEAIIHLIALRLKLSRGGPHSPI